MVVETQSPHRVVGRVSRRIDGDRKVTGAERYTGDLRLPGMLHARPVISPVPHARIRGVDATAALAVPGVVRVLTGQDLPVRGPLNALPGKSPLAFEEVTYVGQFVAMVLAETAQAASDGAALVELDLEELPVVPDHEAGLETDAPAAKLVVAEGDDSEAAMHNADAATASGHEEGPQSANVSNTVAFERGDVDAAFARAAQVVELHLTSEAVHQGYIEPQVALAAIDPLGKLTVYTSTQASFLARARVADWLGLPVHQVVIEPMPVGGGFGGKFILLEPLVAAMAMAAGRPVLLQYTREEDLAAANPAPACSIRVKVGAAEDGTLLALEGDLTYDTGAQSGSPLQIAAILLGGYYRTENLRIHGREVLTNRAPSGAYRAPGAQQASFAIESAIDELALAVGMDPMSFRLKNCAVEGDLRPNGLPWPRIGLKETLQRLSEHPAWVDRKPGTGIAIGGWPGGIEPATAICRLDHGGTFTLVVGSVDLSGTTSGFVKIAAEVLGLNENEVAITSAGTGAAPYAGATGGSKTMYTVGAAVQKAAEEARTQLLEAAAQHLEANAADLEIVDGAIRVRGVPGAQVTIKEIANMSMTFAGKYEPVFGTGSTAITDISPGFAVHLAQVSLDHDTGQVHVDRYVAAQDVGFAIDPAEIEGQIDGGVAQGIGWALNEALVYDAEAQLISGTLTDYALPKATHVPPIEVLLVEVPSEHGPFGAKGVGEPPAIPGPGAIGNAVRDLTGVRITSIPMRPEVVLGALSTANGRA
jgi:CO/xanthine dehydrogenase Mo-binding subunit